MGGGAEAAGDRDSETAAGDGGTVSPERDGHPAGHSTGRIRYSASVVRACITVLFF